MSSKIYEVYVETQFSSAHRLISYNGKCENLHGHNWKIAVIAKSKTINKNSMVIDFNKLKLIVNDVVSELDHKYLNDIKYFSSHQPTAENIARYLHKKIFNKVKKYKINKLKIIVWETPTQYASYEE